MLRAAARILSPIVAVLVPVMHWVQPPEGTEWFGEISALGLAVAGLWMGYGSRPPARPSPLADAVRQGPPPVAWISPLVWETSHEWSRFRGLYAPDDESDELPGDIDAAVVPEDVRRRVPRVAPFAELPTGTLAEHQARLAVTPRVGAWWNPGRWPVCCDRLARIELVNPSSVELVPFEDELLVEGHVLDDALWEGDPESWAGELQVIRDGEPPEHGVNVFACGTCGRLYGVHSHT